MTIEPLNWNIFILGSWNSAILTPNGIGKLLFGLLEGTPLQVEIDLDSFGRYKVTYDDVSVVPHHNSLEINPKALTPECMAKACQVAIKALASLPKTPVSAVGINFRFRINDESESISDIQNALLDKKLSDNQFQFSERIICRAIKLGSHILNLQIVQGTPGEEGSTIIHANFHCETKSKEDMEEWLKESDKFHAMIMDIIKKIEK